LSGNGSLRFQVSQTDSFVFSDFIFHPDVWYHVIISHSVPRAAKASFGIASFNSKQKGVVKLFVNGVPCQHGSLANPRSSLSKVAGRFGSSIPLSTATYVGSVAWQLGNVFLFEETPTYLLYYIY
jgi:hypothetical protein